MEKGEEEIRLGVRKDKYEMMLLPTGLRIANEATTRQNAPNGRPRAGQLLQCALGQANEQTTKNMNVRIETWEETCATLRMTPQRSPFQWELVSKCMDDSCRGGHYICVL